MKKSFLSLILCFLLVTLLGCPPMASRKAFHETSAIGYLRTIFVSQEQFKTLKHYGGNYGSFAQLIDKNLISKGENTKLVNPLVMEKNGYRFEMALQKGKKAKEIPPSFQVVATPLSSSDGTRRFFVNESGDIHFTTDGSPPGPDSPRID